MPHNEDKEFGKFGTHGDRGKNAWRISWAYINRGRDKFQEW